MRHAFRALRRSPGFIAIVITSLALGIGASTAIFSFVNGVLLQRLPVFEPDRLVTFAQVSRENVSSVVWSVRTIDELDARLSGLSDVFGRFEQSLSLSADDHARWVDGEVVTGQYFEALRVQPAEGRLLNADDVRNATGNPVCVLSYAFWQRAFGGDPGVVGREISLNGHGYRVIGVAARGFDGVELHGRFDVAVPATRIGDFVPLFAGPTGTERLQTLSWLAPMARLAPGVQRAGAEQELQQLMRELASERQRELRLVDGSQGVNTLRQSFGRPLLVLMGVVALVLLVACANLANLLFARTQARANELAVRRSLGASRARLSRQLLMESLLLAAGGGIAGVALSFWIADALLAFFNAGRAATSALHVTPDARVLAFAILMPFVVAILFGLAPARQGARLGAARDLQQGPATSGTPSRVLVRKGLVVFQIALSLVIVFGAGLLTRTLQNLAAVDLGYDSERVVALNVDPSASGRSDTEAAAVFDEILLRARGLPGVQAASLAAGALGGSGATTMGIDVPGQVPEVPGDAVVTFNFVGPQYFETVGQPLLRGRSFDDGDTATSARVAVVNETFARRYYTDRDPVGQSFRQGDTSVSIAGVVADALDRGVREAPSEAVYIPAAQGPASRFTLLVRVEGDPQRVVPELVEIARSIDRAVAIISARTLDADVEAGLSSERILVYLSILFAALATLLAGIGLYGVLAYSIVQRTREIGIRIAVGAREHQVVGLFARESAILVLIGLAVGGSLALALARTLRRVLFGVTTTDPLTLLLSASVLLGAGLLATSLPLLRALRVSPVVALRSE